MVDTRSIPPASFEGAQLPQMREWVNGGAGAEALHNKADLWRQEEKFLRDLVERVKGRMAQAHAVIESQGGEAAQNAVAPVVLWTEVAADNAQAQAQTLQDQGEAFAKVKSAIPTPNEEAKVPDNNWFESSYDFFANGFQTDTSVAEEHNQKLRDQAAQAFNTYRDTSQNNVAATPVYSAPPPGGMETAVTSSPQSSVGGGSPSFSGGGSGASPAGSHSSWSGSLPSGGSSGGSAGGTGGHTMPSGSVPSGTTPTGSAPTMPPSSTMPPGSQQPGGPGTSGLVGGMPGAGGGSGSGSGRGAGGVGGRGSGAGAGRGGVGAGGRAGAGGAGGGRGAAGAGAGGRGANGGPGAGGHGAKGKGGEEDEDHYTPEFLKGDQGFFDDELPKVAPPVFGEN